MEDALGDCYIEGSLDDALVLILVLMEDALGGCHGSQKKMC